MSSRSAIYTVSGDVMGCITAYLSDQCIGSLWFCGDSILNNRLENGGVRQFVFERSLKRPLQLWPWIVAKFRGLRTFRFLCKFSTRRNVDHTKQHVGLAELGTLSPGLVGLVFDQQLTLQRRDVDFIVRRFVDIQHLELPLHPKNLNADFPSLQFLGHLELRSLGSCSVAHLQNLSKSVTKLSLIGITLLDNHTILPASVTDLTIRPFRQHLYESSPVANIVLPPNLTTLKFRCFGLWSSSPERTWHTVPRSVTKLSLRTTNKESLTPQLLASFPHELRHLELTCLNFSMAWTEEHIRSLPSTLEFLDLGYINAQDWTASECFKSPGIFPTGLKTLKTLYTWPNEFFLPRDLTSLYTYTVQSGQSLDLPPKLTRLVDRSNWRRTYQPAIVWPNSLKKASGCARWCFPDDQQSLFPPHLTSARLWLHYEQLLQEWPKSLTKLKLHFAPHFGPSGNNDLALTWAPFEEEHTLWSQWLPPTLTSLSIQAIVTNAWMCHLHLPRLKELMVVDLDATADSDWDSLPQDDLLDHRGLAFLPPTITELTLRLMDIRISDLAVLAQQTPKLECATLFLFDGATASPHLPDLPKTLSRMHLYVEAGSYNLFPSKNNLGIEIKYFSKDARSNPKTKWFIKANNG
jgi:hypothetical protein